MYSETVVILNIRVFLFCLYSIRLNNILNKTVNLSKHSHNTYLTATVLKYFPISSDMLSSYFKKNAITYFWTEMAPNEFIIGKLPSCINQHFLSVDLSFYLLFNLKCWNSRYPFWTLFNVATTTFLPLRTKNNSHKSAPNIPLSQKCVVYITIRRKPE